MATLCVRQTVDGTFVLQNRWTGIILPKEYRSSKTAHRKAIKIEKRFSKSIHKISRRVDKRMGKK